MFVHFWTAAAASADVVDVKTINWMNLLCTECAILKAILFYIHFSSFIFYYFVDGGNDTKVTEKKNERKWTKLIALKNINLVSRAQSTCLNRCYKFKKEILKKKLCTSIMTNRINFVRYFMIRFV